ncbi:MAG: SprT-like domain-containing protein [Verrucomicrobiota bacterium]
MSSPLSRRSGLDEPLTRLVRQWLVQAGAPLPAVRTTVVWNPLMRTTAGTAQPRTSRIELNPKLLALGEPEVHRTLRHEAAHLLAHWRSGSRRISTHGPEWRQACTDLGIPGERATHTLPFPRRRLTPRYFYQCPACALIVRRVRRISRATACLHCCRTHNGGHFDARFQFQRIPPPAEAPPPS